MFAPKRIHTINLIRHCSICSTSLNKKFSNGAKASLVLHSGFNYINGVRVLAEKSVTEKNISITEPATGNVLCDLSPSSEAVLDHAFDSAHSAFQKWSLQPVSTRADIMLKTSREIRTNLDALAYWEVRDTGKPIREARDDVIAAADSFRYFGKTVGTGLTGEQICLTSTSHAYTRREPFGVCASIGVWNFPFLTAAWKAAPALATGNTVVYKPSPLTPITAVLLAEILTNSGLPPGCFNVVQGGAATGERMCTHPKVAKVSFTGSVPTGTAVMAACSKGIKKLTLELGGKSPLIVFEDCDMENAVNAALIANFLSQGQVCSNAARVFVHQSIYSEFAQKVVTATAKLKIGDPRNDNTNVGATITRDHAQKVLGYISTAKSEGASLLHGGERIIPDDVNLKDGWYVSPCVLANCKDEMTCVKEEIFGAVMTLLPFSTEEEVVNRANNTPFGLSAGLCTRDLNRAHRVAAALQAGNVWVNTYNAYPPEVSFGGCKMSGFGRENGKGAILDYTLVKTVLMELGKIGNYFD